MKRFSLLLFLILYFFCYVLSDVHAQDPELISIFLGRLVISPTRAAQPIDQTSENVSVVDLGGSEGAPPGNPAEAVENIPGLDIDLRTKSSHAAPLSIQGSTSDHVLVMEDGIPFNTEASGQADILPLLSSQNLERIEVIKGSASSAWGESSGGVVHLITKDVGDTAVPKGGVTNSWAGFGGLKTSAELKGAVQKLGYYVSGDYAESGGARRAGGVPNRDDTLLKKGFWKFAYPVSDHLKTTASFGYAGAQLNEGIYISDGTRTEMPYFARYGQLRFDADPDARNHLEGALKFNRQSIVSDWLDGTTGDLLSMTRTANNYYGADIKSVTKHRREDTLVAGLDVSRTFLKSNQLDRVRDIEVQAPYANYTLVWKNIDLTGGARYDLNGEYGSQFNPSLGAVCHLPGDSHTLLRANVARSFHAPPLLWKYFENIAPGVTKNNPDLRPERAVDTQVGIESRLVPRLWLKLSLYRSDISDAIATVEDTDGFYVKRNFQRFRQQGCELESKLKLDHDVWLSFAGVFNDVENRETHETVQNRGVTRPSFRLGLDLQTIGGFKFNFTGRYNRWDSSSAAMPNDRKFIFDGKVFREITELPGGVRVICFISAYNLTNSKYWSNQDFPLPPRYFEGGVTLKF